MLKTNFSWHQVGCWQLTAVQALETCQHFATDVCLPRDINHVTRRPSY